MSAAFTGWSPAVFDFYRQLELNNNKTFWTANKSIYATEVRAPFDALSEIVADEFGPLKVFRPNRDVRFSKNKEPYKTGCYGVAEGEGGERYYVGVSHSQGLVAGSGFWMMAPDQLVRFRRAVDDQATGEQLETIVAEVRAKTLEIQGHSLKTAPRGYPRDHPRIELLRQTSLAAMRSWDQAAWMGTKSAATRITDTWRAGAPMNVWLAAHVGPSDEPPNERW